MKQDQQTTCSGSRTTSADVCRWIQTLFDLHARIAARFARSEPCRRTLAYLQGILSEMERSFLEDHPWCDRLCSPLLLHIAFPGRHKGSDRH